MCCDNGLAVAVVQHVSISFRTTEKRHLQGNTWEPVDGHYPLNKAVVSWENQRSFPFAMIHLLDLPNEIICAIGSQVPVKTLKQLRLCNSRLRDALSPVLFTSVVFGVTPKPTHICNSFSRYVKCLFIGSWGCGKKLDPSALSQFRNVRTVRWQLTATESEEMVTKIFEYLSSLPSLSELYFTSYRSSSFSLPFDRFGIHSLSVLSVQGPFSDSHGVAPALSRFIMNNPSLTSISLDVAWSSDPLHSSHLFESLPPDFCSSLHHLRLPRWHVDFSSSQIRMMSALSSLDVTLLPPPSVNNDALWDLLQEEGIHLKELSVSVVCQELLDYLQSYSGLESLVLSDVESNGTHDASHQFYQKALPNHSETLVSLSVDARNTHDWCLTPKYAVAFQRYRRMENLSVSVRAEDFAAVKSLLSHAPLSLRSLSLAWNATLSDRFRSSFLNMYDCDTVEEPCMSNRTLVVYADIVYLLGRVDNSGFVFRGFKTHRSQMEWTAASRLYGGA